MPFCPNCRREFQNCVKVCPHCGTELVDQLTPEVVLKSLPIRLVTVSDYYYSMLAYLDKAKLESEGIQSVVFDDIIINTNWLYAIAIGGVKLKVAESDAPEAIRILKEVRDFIPDLAKQPEDGCPNCGSSYIHYETFHLRRIFGVWALSYLISDSITSVFVILLPFLKKKWKCNNCGYQWKEK